MASPSNKKADAELRTIAVEFIDSFRDAVAKSEEEISQIMKGRNFSYFEGNFVDLNAVAQPLARFVIRAAKLLGSKAGNEEGIRKQAYSSAQAALLNETPTTSAVAELIESVFDPPEFEFIVPNHLIRFKDAVRSLAIGRVKATLTEDFITEFRGRFPSSHLDVSLGEDYKFSWPSGTSSTFSVELHPVAWVVKVGAAKANVEEEAKWLIDIAISFLRLHYENEPGYFPTNGKVEPHPIRQSRSDHVGLKIQGSTPLAGGESLHPWYEASTALETITLSAPFVAKASLIFDPPNGSLAERVAQGLGWLTRGRQAEDRTERLLYFFTAIEALLSHNDKTAPVVQTIARHASVILSNNNEIRCKISSRLKKLYENRSALIHAGKRGVLWIEANEAQRYAEGLFHKVLSRVPLRMPHDTFCNHLAKASFGTEWPPVIT